MDSKNKDIIAFVAFSPTVIPYKTRFRFERKWWERRDGSLNFASLSEGQSGWMLREMKDSDIVGISKKSLLERNYNKILKEVSI